MPLDEWRQLFELSDRHGFVIASDECYSEIYFRDEPRWAACKRRRPWAASDFRNLVAFTSLSKRSNVPGMRSGFVAGDARWMKAFLLYRTYHGSAMSPLVQRASIAAWNDEAHVVANRELYRAKFAQVTPLLAGCWTCAARRRLLPLGRRAPGTATTKWPSPRACSLNTMSTSCRAACWPARAHGPPNPGAGRIRMALVAGVDECLEAAQRIVAYTENLQRMSTTSAAIRHRPGLGIRAEITAANAPEVREAVEQVIADLNAGRLRVAERQGVGEWQVNQWVKKAVLLSFRLNDNRSCAPATWSSSTRCRPSSAPGRSADARQRRARGAAGRGAPRQLHRARASC
jgi:hypothetical protein